MNPTSLIGASFATLSFVARRREPGVTLEQIAPDFGVHPMTLSKWLRKAAVDDSDRLGVSSSGCT